MDHPNIYISTLIKRCLPRMFINCIINWYSRLVINVRWNNCLSTDLNIYSGVRQGGILSAIFFNLCVNPLIKSLRKSDLGCQLRTIYTGCIMYADDLILVSASVIDLQNMLDNCSTIGSVLGISFNCNKSKCMFVGPHQGFHQPLSFLIVCLCSGYKNYFSWSSN